MASRVRGCIGGMFVGLVALSCREACDASNNARTEGSSTVAPIVEWSEPIDVASGPAIAGPWRMNDSHFYYVDDATVAVHSDGSAFVAWVDNRRQDVFFQSHAADGHARGTPVNVSRTPQVFSWLPRMEVRGEDVYVLWQEIVFSGGSHGGEAFFARSSDRGASFAPPINLSSTQAGCGKGRLTTKRWDNGSLDLALGSDGAIFAAWTEYQGPLRLSRSTDGGESFSSPVHVAGNRDRPARAPSLAVADDTTVYVAWTVGERDEANIQLAKSEDAGRSFESLGAAYTTGGHSDAPKIALDSKGRIHLVHGESPSGMFGRYHVRHVRLDAAGKALERPRVLAPPRRRAQAANFPSLAVDGRDNVHVVWEHYPDPRERPRGLGYASSGDGGESFSAASVVAGTGESQPGVNGSLQGLLSRKLDVNQAGSIAVVNSSFDAGALSLIRLVRAPAGPPSRQ